MRKHQNGQIWIAEGIMLGKYVCVIKDDDFHGIYVVKRLDKDIEHYIGEDSFKRKLGDNLEDAKRDFSVYFI